MALLPFEISLKPDGRGHIVIDGEDISDRVVAVRVDGAVRQIPTVTVELSAYGAIEGVGNIEVVQPVADTNYLLAFLGALDADTLEKEVTASLGWGGESSYTAALLKRLQDIARGL